jgi:hypothetical protein
MSSVLEKGTPQDPEGAHIEKSVRSGESGLNAAAVHHEDDPLVSLTAAASSGWSIC